MTTVLQPILNGAAIPFQGRFEGNTTDSGQVAHVVIETGAAGGVVGPANPLPVTNTQSPALNGDGGALSHITNFPATQAVSATALPLPVGAATAAAQTAVQSPPGTSATTAQGVQGVTGGVPLSTVAPAAGNGTDHSANPPSALAQLSSGIVKNPGQLYVQNQSDNVLQLWLQGQSAPIIIGLSGPSAEWSAAKNMPWFTGTFTINGPSGSSLFANSN